MATSRAAELYARLGQRIRSLRIRAGFSQAALGARLHRSASAIDRYEMGQRRISLADLLRLAGVFGVAYDTLLEPVGGERRSGARSAARSRSVDLRTEHLRLLRALDRRLAYPTQGPRTGRVAEEPAAYVGSRAAGRRAAPKDVAASLSERQLRRYAQRAGLPAATDAEALRRYAELVLEAAMPRTGRTRRAAPRA